MTIRERIIKLAMVVRETGFNKESANIITVIKELKNLPEWASDMRPVLKEVWHAVSRLKGNLHLAREAYLVGVDGMKTLKESKLVKWQQLWDGLNAYRDALKDLADLKPKIKEFLVYDNKYIVNYANSTLKAIDEILDGKIDDMEHILSQIKWH